MFEMSFFIISAFNIILHVHGGFASENARGDRPHIYFSSNEHVL